MTIYPIVIDKIHTHTGEYTYIYIISARQAFGISLSHTQYRLERIIYNWCEVSHHSNILFFEMRTDCGAQDQTGPRSLNRFHRATYNRCDSFPQGIVVQHHSANKTKLMVICILYQLTRFIRSLDQISANERFRIKYTQLCVSCFLTSIACSSLAALCAGRVLANVLHRLRILYQSPKRFQ